MSFGDENVSTSGTLGSGVLTAATGSKIGTLTLGSSPSVSFSAETDSGLNCNQNSNIAADFSGTSGYLYTDISANKNTLLKYSFLK